MGKAQSALDAQEVTAQKPSADNGEGASIEAAAPVEKVSSLKTTKVAEDNQKPISRRQSCPSVRLENTEDEARTPAAAVEPRSTGSSQVEPRKTVREKAEVLKASADKVSADKAERLKLIVLERQKADAIAKNEFMRANKIMKVIKALKAHKDTLLELARQKAGAIAKNDFMRANRIMKEIVALTAKKEAALELASSELVVAELDAPKQEPVDPAVVAKSAADKETRALCVTRNGEARSHGVTRSRGRQVSAQVTAEEESAESSPLPSDSSTAMVAREFEIRTYEVTRRLGRQFDGLFPGRNLGKSPHTIVVLCIKTRNRMSAMSSDMLEERTEHYELLIGRMQVFRDSLIAAGYWCDFMDPSSGAPFHSDSATTFAESDDRVRSVGFEILELGCCRVACSKKYGQCMVMTTAFVDTTAENITEALKLLEKDP